MSKSNHSVVTSRRLFLKQSLNVAAVAAGSTLCASPAIAAIESAIDLTYGVADLPDRELRLVNAHTWEKLDIVYWTQGVYIDESLQQINHLMRDHRADKEANMDPRLLDNLYKLCRILDTDKRVHILSGYRTPETNAKLRARSSGVAKHSLHMEARAIDINIPTFSTNAVHKAAVSMQAGGVGYYSKSGFVHIDTGRVRHWGA